MHSNQEKKQAYFSIFVQDFDSFVVANCPEILRTGIESQRQLDRIVLSHSSIRSADCRGAI